MNKHITNLAVCAFLISGTGLYAQTDSTATEATESTAATETAVEEDFFELSLDELMDIEVTSVSKKAERLQDVAAALYVLTQEDIKNSSATTIHELLREVPGYWGVQDEYNNVTSAMRYSSVENGGTGTVLYLLDGTPIQDLMSSTFTNRNFDIPLDEIDRIEIIKGSGGVIYGANSATGVVNIFTKAPDKYDGVHAKVEAAYPGYGNATLRAGGKVNDKLAVSGYGKMRYMEGYGLVPEFEGETVTVPKNDGSGDTTVKNQFTENFEKSIAFTLGLKLKYTLSEKTSISLNTHFNTMKKSHYTSYDLPLSMFDGFARNDVKVYKDATHNRLVANVRLDHEFNENHSGFVRVSTNYEDDYAKLSGGAQVSNSIIDFEAQDNLSIGINDLSVGGNFRTVNFNIHDINDPISLQYINPQTNETLLGFFAQDKIRLVEDKLDLLVGVKAENYTLVNDQFYFSPMAKASYRPTQKLTLWGGFTQSYTTPGFNNTNIDLLLVSADPNPFGVGNTGVINGSQTVPTKFQTAEVGVKAKIKGVFQFESNFFYSWITDGIAASTENPVTLDSPTRPGVTADYYYYGNYIKGTTVGTETFVRYRPKKELMVELSHTFLQSEWENQENPDFEVDELTDEQNNRTPEVSAIPRHIWRVRGWYEFSKVYTVSASVIYGTRFNTNSSYQYPEQRAVGVLGGEGTEVAKNVDRGIVNLRFERTFSDDKLSIYLFGNDIFNSGIIAQTTPLSNTTLSKIGAMYGIGAVLKIK